MKTIIEDNQLDSELQELYIISSHWNSDISFVQDEIRFLKNMLNKYPARTKADQMAHFYKNLEKQEDTSRAIKNKISVFLKFVELFIIDPQKEMGLDMIEKFNVLGAEIKSISEYVKLVKKLVFDSVEGAIKPGEYTAATIAKPTPVKIKRSISYML